MLKTLIGDAKTMSQIVNDDVTSCVAKTTAAESKKYSQRTICVVNMKNRDA